MELVPTQEEVIALLTRTGALRSGHFEYPNGLHATQHLQLPLAMRSFQNTRSLSVGLSRLVRAHTEIRALLPQLSIVAPAPNGLPLAYPMAEALHAKQVYWATKDDATNEMVFPQYIRPEAGEKVLLVDDILRTGTKLGGLKRAVEAHGAEVAGLAVIIAQPEPGAPDFQPLPFFYLARLDALFFRDAESFAQSHPGVTAEKVWG